MLFDSTNLSRFVAELAEFNCKKFGRAMYGTLATVANVVFGLDGQKAIKAKTVREILRRTAPTRWDLADTSNSP
jgi:hypothetical protein